tara:strand:- start:116 stop:709 length:594 start_codon:yes stop_codon:yes gene_type:complete
MNIIVNKHYEGKTGSGQQSGEYPDFVNTYGEITYEGFKQCFKGISTKDKVFYDLGSGIGKLVVYNGLEKKFKKTIGVELNKNRHLIAKETLKHIKKDIKKKGVKSYIDKSKKITFIHDSLFNKKYFNGNVYFISNLCFTEEMNKKLAYFFDTYNKKKNTIIFCSKQLPILSPVKRVQQMNCTMTWSQDSQIYKYTLF